jgi:protocatechuate 3,4-dioxygenase beta subunit
MVKRQQRYLMVVTVGCLAAGVFPAGVLPYGFSPVGLKIAFAEPISVRVVDEAEQPIAGARVWFLAGDMDTLRTSTTDANGIAFTEVPGNDQGNEMTATWATVLAPGKAVGGGVIYKTSTANPNLKPRQMKLGPPVSLAGTVQDKNGKPVANAEVHLRFVFSQEENDILDIESLPTQVVLGEGAGWEPFTVRTDAAGRWRFDFLPPGRSANYELVDERFVRLSGSIPLLTGGTNEAKPLVARSGAILMGRVVDDKGLPLAGIRVGASNRSHNDSHDEAITDADGTYRMTRIGTCLVTVKAGVAKRNAPLVAPPTPPVRATEGAMSKVADLVFTSGALVQGRVTDASNGQPVVGASISVPGNLTNTNAQGRYSVRALPGAGKVYLMGKPVEYLDPKIGSPSSPIAVNLIKGATKEISFALPPAKPLVGVVRDQAGQPVAGATIAAGEFWKRQHGKTDKEGLFSIKGVEDGEVRLSMRGDWTIVKPAQVKVPLLAPLVVQVRREQNVPLAGRVVDDKGVAVPGAEVSINETMKVAVDDWDSMGTRVFTDMEGRWRWTPTRPDSTFQITATKDTYRLVTGGTIMPPRQIMTVSGVMIPDPNSQREVTDFVLQKLSARLAGRVLDERGQPLAGINVWTTTSKTVSDDDGAWQLLDLPPATLEVFAAKEKLFGEAKVTPQMTSEAGAATVSSTVPAGTVDAGTVDAGNVQGGTVDIILKLLAASPPSDAAARAFAERLLADNSEIGARTILPVLALTDPDTALLWAARVKPMNRTGRNGIQPPSDAEIRTEIALIALSNFARYNPASARERMPDLLGALPAPAAGIEAVRLALELVPYMPDEAREIYNREKALLPAVPDGKYPNRSKALLLAALAARLGQHDEAFAVAEPVIDQFLATQTEADHVYQWAAPIYEVALGGTLLAERVLAKYPAERRTSAAHHAVIVLAGNDLAGARRLLETVAPKPIGENNAAADNATADNVAGGGALVAISARDQSDHDYHRALYAVIQRLAPTDPAPALALARGVTAEWHKGNALALAAAGQQGEERTKLLREAATAGDDSPVSTSLAQYALLLDPRLGEELVVDLAQGMLTGSRNAEEISIYRLPGLAWVLGRIHPGQTRLLLERGWERRKDEHWSQRQEIILAMAAVDWNRAVELANSLPSVDAAGKVLENERPSMLRLLAKFALTPDEIRRRYPMDAIQNSTYSPNRSFIE